MFHKHQRGEKIMSEEIGNDLMRLAECCGAFREAVSEHIQEKPELAAKAMASLTEQEVEELQDMAQELVTHGLSAAFGKVTKEFVDLTIKSAESTADLAGRVMDVAELAQFIPQDLKSEKGARQLEENNAPKFAALCRQSI